MRHAERQPDSASSSRWLPGPWFNSVSRTEYERLYFAQLALLDAGVVAEHLIALAGPAEPVLLCWEHKAGILNGTTWCHRHMVADWFQQTLGQTVEEL